MDEKLPLHIVLETGSMAGGVRVVGEIANRLANRGWTVDIWSVNQKETMTSWFSLSPKVKWYSFLRKGTTEDYDQLASVLEKQPGWKMATFWRTAYPVTIACEKQGKGLYLCQDVETSYTSQPIAVELVLKSYTQPLRKITTSRWVEKQLGCEYIGIGVDNFYKVLGSSTRNNQPLAIERRQALKGWGDLMEVNRYLSVAGKHITTFGQDSGIKTFVNFNHIVRPTDRDVRDLYNKYGCFVSTSKHEGFGLPLVEAMACGCPVVTTNADGNMEFCEEGINCLVSKNNLDMAEKIMGLLADKTIANKLSKAALEVPRRYQWKDVIQRLEQILMAD